MKQLLAIVLFSLSLLTYSQNKKTGSDFIQTLLVDKNYEKAYSYFDETVKGQITLPILEQTINQLESQLGKFKNIIEINEESGVYYYYSDFEKMKLDIKIAFRNSDKIAGFFFAPHKPFDKEPSLGKTYNVTSNSIELKGTLLVPAENNLKKLIILLHGSGPHDRDETIAENKPFKDIAENLYQKGIASYRFDKRTFSNPESFSDKSTIDDEVVVDALNIVNHFKTNPDFKDYEIILVGHSLGAYLLPKIANKTTQVSKIVLMAGNARPLDQLIIEQYDYLYSLNPSEEFNKEVVKTKEQIAFLNSKDFNSESPKEKLPLNLSAAYWKSLLEYQPSTEVKKVKIPMLILQGERDYQVTMTDFNLWKTALQKNKKAKFISYPSLNHLFMSGTGKAKPEEYLVKSNVDQKVTDDIFNFIVTKQ
ncbi:MAG TPA: alpha/beta fold hydrolase [Flavobacterium sp.]|uniref:alpha/beta hydrolase n=1 Tax=Flavobacterium sp. TaxID=239 RepID=UPI002BBDE727|nr:alpha/beta fold hydrolase [Flavobacterium sp.]HSD13182.1 alpha/beta fold hydrolase [Flavobacterium sp.]